MDKKSKEIIDKSILDYVKSRNYNQKIILK